MAGQVRTERLMHDENIGHRLVREMPREHVRRILSKRADTPGAANSVLQKLRVLIHFAIDNGLRKDDPTLRIKKYAKGEFHTWTEDELTQYERKWPIGTTKRLAFALLLYTGQRRSDVVTMSWGDVKDGMIGVTPLKTKRTSGVKLWIPIHPELQAVLNAAERDGDAILQTAFGQPFTSNGLGSGFMAVKIEKAGLPERCVTHGLRKAAARRLAEAGCTANEIASITGHATLQEVSHYTKAAEQKKLAQSAMRRLSPPKPRSDSQTTPRGLGIPPKKPTKSEVVRRLGGTEGHATKRLSQKFQSLRPDASLNVAQSCGTPLWCMLQDCRSKLMSRLAREINLSTAQKRASSQLVHDD